jgi:hypothetical protein
MTLDADELMARARRETRLETYGEGPLAEPLDVFCRSLNDEAGLGEAAEEGVRATILAALAERLRLEDWFARHPDILQQPLAKPVNIMGLPRSGTTALQQFLSVDPDMRSIRRWELSTPTPPPDEGGPEDPRIAATAAAFAERDRRFPHFRSMLPLAATDPSEHNWPMNLTFTNVQMATIYDAPSYERWMFETDITFGYAYLVRVLKLLQWKTPRARWNLKNPMDIFFLPAFTHAFPGSLLVWLHRDPVSTLGSSCSLIATMREFTHQEVDRERLGRHLLDFLARGVRRAMRDRDRLRLPIIDLYNRDVAADPIASIGALYEKLGLTFTGAFEAQLRARMADRPRGQFGRHTYDLKDFGLSVAEVRQRFGDYTDRFEIPLEA